ncbi:hypothetical protein RHSIM_Rhsim01G0252600 [Rhododendron simsii]|uniref:TF-B3 domain-containing protein n=1 Tax=Rhododendron simsii TaxID=118357 RepID=A0A834HSX2_RHOSS|nr:hypothetical protein RHSIM_Rhsim01G0252600 [Rhododendron simsii]
MSERGELDAVPSDIGEKRKRDSKGKEKEEEQEEEAKSKEDVSEEQSHDQSTQNPSDASSPFQIWRWYSTNFDWNPFFLEQSNDDTTGGHAQNPSATLIHGDSEPEAQTTDSLFQEAKKVAQPARGAGYNWELNFNLFGDDTAEHLKILYLYKRATQKLPAAEAGYSRDLELLLEEKEADWPNDLFLFEMQAPNDNILTIPAQMAAEYFTILSLQEAIPDEKITLRFTDAEARNWEIPFEYHPEEQAFTNAIMWAVISYLHKLKESDLILFYRPVPRLNLGHYLIEFDRRQEYEDHKPEFRRDNFLFPLKLDQNARISLPRVEVLIHLPEVRIPPGIQKTVTIKLTDSRRKNWYMDILRYDVSSYRIVKGWGEFVQKHELGATDVIRFYKPVNPSHKKHFLIEIVKNRSGGANRAGPSHGGSSKGKEIASWIGCGESGRRSVAK